MYRYKHQRKISVLERASGELLQIKDLRSQHPSDASVALSDFPRAMEFWKKSFGDKVYTYIHIHIHIYDHDSSFLSLSLSLSSSLGTYIYAYIYIRLIPHAHMIT